MKRYYYLSNDIDNTAQFEQKLVHSGVEKQHIHVYGISDTQAQHYALTPVLSIFKTDLVHYLLRGLFVGLILSAVLTALLIVFQVPNVVLLSIIGSIFLTGFVTWEAGLIGLHKVNYKFSPLKKLLTDTNHLVMVDVDAQQASLLCEQAKRLKCIVPVAVGSNLVNPFEQQETLLF
ncbi:hypothetical protein [Thalassotalea eurytherma]|uniref:NAD/FAD-utilizing enzyme n=1 Tax=Thalassotalea eurytherma TaxID=1144278 RepID=A0ABQ6H5U5_9GAMM|nr:hypothetical protein [Thalassotalea eurytherma]GLX83528.1 hypothetical protein theurythT_29810 [Thalassotalea eurytherma]